MLRLGRAALVGRARELQVLDAALTDARQGQSRFVLLTGEPGIGKSRLLEEFPPLELARDAIVLRGGASQLEGMPPYFPLVEALGEYIALAPPQVLRAELGEDAAVLTRILPQVAARAGDSLGAPLPIPPEQERLRLYEAVAGFMINLSTVRGALILELDDLQWVDAGSCDLIAHLARRLAARRAPVLFVGASRDTEISENSALSSLIAELNRRRFLVSVSVRPLHVKDTERLAAGLLQGEVASDLSTLLHGQAEGNPFFAEELLRSLVEDGALALRDNRWRLARGTGPLLPRGIVDTVRARLARIPSSAIEVLRVAAVIGRTVDVRLLGNVLGEDPQEVERLLLDCVPAHLVQPDPGGGYTFVHDKVREALAVDVVGERRRQLHRRIGEALEADGEASQRLQDLAFHFGRAADSERGVRYAISAGRRALSAAAAIDAAEHFRTALRLLNKDGAAEMRLAAHFGLAEAASQAGLYGESAANYEAIIPITNLSGDNVSAARAWRGLAHARWRQEQIYAARRAFESALDSFGPADDSDCAETLLELADLLALSMADAATGEQYAVRATTMIERLGDRRLQATACLSMGAVRFRGNRLKEGRALLEQGLTLALEEDAAALAAEICGHLASACAYDADLSRSWEVGQLRCELALRTRDPFLLRHVHLWLAAVAVWRGDWRAFDLMIPLAEEAVHEIESPEPSSYLGIVRGLRHYYRGHFPQARAEFHEALAAMRQTTSDVLWMTGWSGMVLVEEGRREEALASFAELERLTRARRDQDTMLGYARTQLALGWHRLGEHERAAECYPQLLRFRGQAHCLLVDRALAAAADSGGDRFAALAHLRDAEATARRAGMQPELVMSLLQRGLLERELGQVNARVTLDAGLELAATVDMSALAENWTGLRQRRERRPDGLSRREIEVLGLVAQGYTNRDIAATLVLSEKTVTNHLTAIFAKTGVQNRAAATAYAFRFGLMQNQDADS